MELFTKEADYLPQVKRMKEPFDLIRFALKHVTFADVLAAIRVQYPDKPGLVLYKHGNTVAIQQSGGECGIGKQGVQI